ncbi:MAG: 6-bladed beta-propeller [Marinifilaceae bacterium]|nr:6-bladed beta-propeller [Marinifilaceae bacterium]
MRIKLALIVLATLLLSCNRDNKEDRNLLCLDVLHSAKKNISFSSIKLIPLETRKDNFLGDRLKIKLDNNEIYIADLEGHKSIFYFNSDGRFENKIGLQGKGPQEYINLVDFIVSGDTIEVLSGAGTISQITGFNKNGTFIYSRTFNLGVTSFEKIGSSYVFYTGFNKVLHPYRIYTSDISGKNMKPYLENNTQINLPLYENNFFRLDSLLYFKESFFNCTYEYKNNLFAKKFVLDFGKLNIPNKFYKLNIHKGFELIDNRGFACVKNYFENKRFSAFEIIEQKKNTDTKIHHVLFDKFNMNMTSNTFNESNSFPLKNMVSITKNDELVYVVYPVDIMKNISEFDKLPISNKQILENVAENDNPILFFCKISTHEE